MTSPTGREAIAQLRAEGRLQQVSAPADDADALLDAARRHLTSAQVLAETDPGGAYSLLHDAARKSLAALLQASAERLHHAARHLVEDLDVWEA